MRIVAAGQRAPDQTPASLWEDTLPWPQAPLADGRRGSDPGVGAGSLSRVPLTRGAPAASHSLSSNGSQVRPRPVRTRLPRQGCLCHLARVTACTDDPVIRSGFYRHRLPNKAARRQAGTRVYTHVLCLSAPLNSSPGIFQTTGRWLFRFHLSLGLRWFFSMASTSHFISVCSKLFFS